MTVDLPERPPDWARWPREARMAYLSMHYSRLELVDQLLEAVDREPDPNRDDFKYRLTKEELSAILSELERS